jgi:hypothetical protein
MNHLVDFIKFNESVGLADATLIYNKFLTTEYEKFIEKFLLTNKDVYEESHYYKREDLLEFIESNNWEKWPVSEIYVEFSIKIMTDEKFTEKYPKKSSIYKENFTTTGACYPIVGYRKNQSYTIDSIDDRTDVSIHLRMELGGVVSRKFKFEEDLNFLLLEIESTVAHELNHAYEGWRRSSSGSPNLSADLTWALDDNRSKIKSEIWRVWYKNIGFNIYFSERHEVNAIVQEAWPYVQKYDLDELKKISPSWRTSDILSKFKATEFKKEMYDIITKFYPESEVDMVLLKLKNGLANKLIKTREKSEMLSEDKPSILGERIRKMSVDQFLIFVEKRLNLAGIKIKRKILRLYSLK